MQRPEGHLYSAAEPGRVEEMREGLNLQEVVPARTRSHATSSAKHSYRVGMTRQNPIACSAGDRQAVEEVEEPEVLEVAEAPGKVEQAEQAAQEYSSVRSAREVTLVDQLNFRQALAAQE